MLTIFDPVTNLEFKVDYLNLLNAEKMVNFLLFNGKQVSLNDFYTMLDIKTTDIGNEIVFDPEKVKHFYIESFPYLNQKNRVIDRIEYCFSYSWAHELNWRLREKYRPYYET